MPPKRSTGHGQSPSMDGSALWMARATCANRALVNAQLPASIDVTVHVGQWRTWKEAELMGGQIPEGYNKEAKGLFARYFKQKDAEPAKPAGTGLPWSTQGVLNLRRKVDKPADKEGRDVKDKDAKGDARSSKVAKITEVEKQLRDLKRNFKQEDEAAGRKKRRSPASSKGCEKKRAKKKPFDKGGLDKGDDNEMGADWGGSDGPSEDGSSSEGSSSQRPKQGKKKARRSDSEDDRKEKKRRKDKKRHRSKSPKKKKKRKSTKERLDKDKGPFGVGETAR